MLSNLKKTLEEEKLSCQSSVSVNQHFCLIQFIPKHNCEHFYLPPPPSSPSTLFFIPSPSNLPPHPSAPLITPPSPYSFFLTLFLVCGKFHDHTRRLSFEFVQSFVKKYDRADSYMLLSFLFLRPPVRYISLPSYRLLLMGALVNF